MIWVLFALLAVAAWGLWFILQWSVAVPVVASVALGLGALGLFVYRALRAGRSAAALERAILEQGRQQAQGVRPERREEIQALEKQMTDGIRALKQSKLRGRRRGGGALYTLPWYAIIGPPGAGKTTALKHSGMMFPYADTSVRGVGGTRNCDWWFTNEAILLDTAGRYTTEHEDQREWLAFLGMLAKYRSDKPLNGLILALSVTDVLDASPPQIEAMGKKLRARVDEVMSKLGMVLPVYLLVTKCDLMAGFAEIFGDMKKSDRVQSWGATLPLGADKSQPGAIFAREFELLAESAWQRALKRLAHERDRRARERIYQFPLELAGLKANLTELMGHVFQVNSFQDTPLLRGFYFTSGTQEGAPLSRVVARMGQAMGIRPAESGAPQPVESKSYFLHDVFVKVVFPDAAVAGRSARELRRRRATRLAVGAAALGVAVLFAIPSVLSYFRNRALLAATLAECRAAAGLVWRDATSHAKGIDPVDDNLAALRPLAERVRALGAGARGVPFGMGFFMYAGDAIYKPALALYVKALQEGFVLDADEELGPVLAGAKGREHYVDERLALKSYLMLHEPEHLCAGEACGSEPSAEDVAWPTGELTERWFHARATRAKDVGTLRERMRFQVETYLALLGAGEVKAVPAEPSFVAAARRALGAGTSASERYYRLFVDILHRQKLDAAGDSSLANLAFPPLTLLAAFDPGRVGGVTKWLHSKVNQAASKVAGGRSSDKYYAVDGVYTLAGRVAVYSNFKEAADILTRDAWVVPPAQDEFAQVPAALRDLKARYDGEFVEAWQGFLLNLELATPQSLEQAKQLYLMLADSPRPLLEVARLVVEHTQWRNAAQNKDVIDLAKRFERSASARAQALTRFRVDLDVNELIEKGVSKIPGVFRSVMAMAEGGAALDRFATAAEHLRGVIAEKQLREPNLTVADLRAEVQGRLTEATALVPHDDAFARLVFLPLFQNAFNIQGQFTLANPARG